MPELCHEISVSSKPKMAWRIPALLFDQRRFNVLRELDEEVLYLAAHRRSSCLGIVVCRPVALPASATTEFFHVRGVSQLPTKLLGVHRIEHLSVVHVSPPVRVKFFTRLGIVPDFVFFVCVIYIRQTSPLWPTDCPKDSHGSMLGDRLPTARSGRQVSVSRTA